MSETKIEHLNISVSNIEKSVDYLNQIFGWEVRWQGSGKAEGSTTHIGNADQYLALWHSSIEGQASYQGLNHIGVVVDDLESVRSKVQAYGFKPVSYDDYEPGRRFYFVDHDDIEYEVVSYQS